MTDNVVFYTLHLFAGAGGGILADKYLGFRPIGAVEINAYCRRVLLQRQLDGLLPDFPIWDDVTTFRADNPDTRDYINRLRGIRDRLIICGGFPCQDISSAGKGAGIQGARSGLWSEYNRIISEIRPAAVFVENSPMLIRRGADRVITDIVKNGYSVTWRVISAQDVGAPHERKRFWGLAIRDVPDTDDARPQTIGAETNKQESLFRLSALCNSIPDTLYTRRIRRLRSSAEAKELEAPNRRGESVNGKRQRRQTQPEFCRVANGISDWLDATLRGEFWTPDELGLPRIIKESNNRRQRLMAIGNAQVPLCAAVAFVTLLNTFKEVTTNEQ